MIKHTTGVLLLREYRVEVRPTVVCRASWVLSWRFSRVVWCANRRVIAWHGWCGARCTPLQYCHFSVTFLYELHCNHCLGLAVFYKGTQITVKMRFVRREESQKREQKKQRIRKNLKIHNLEDKLIENKIWSCGCVLNWRHIYLWCPAGRPVLWWISVVDRATCPGCSTHRCSWFWATSPPTCWSDT